MDSTSIRCRFMLVPTLLPPEGMGSKPPSKPEQPPKSNRYGREFGRDLVHHPRRNSHDLRFSVQQLNLRCGADGSTTLYSVPTCFRILMSSTANSFPDPTLNQQLQVLLNKTDSASSVTELRKLLEQMRKQLDATCEQNAALADAVVNSAQVIDELEQTKHQLALAQNEAEQAASNTRLLSDTIFERTHDAMLVLNSDHTLLSANQNANHLFQSDFSSHDENLMQYLADRYTVEGAGENWLDNVLDELDEKGSAGRELLLTGDRKRWIDISFSLFQMRDGEHFLLIGRDITARKEFENELRRRRDFLHNTIDAIPDLLCVKSSDFEPVLVNNSFRESCLESSPASPEEAQLIERGGDSEDQHTLTDSGGRERTFSTRRSVFSDPVTREKFLVSASRDITEQKIIEDRNRLLASVFENAQEGVVILDVEGNVCEANPEFCGLSGCSQEQLLNQSLSSIIAWEHLEFSEVLQSALEGKPCYGRVVLSRGSKREREVVYWGSLSVSRDERGRATNLIAMFSDISQIEQTQQRLHRQALHDNLTGLPNRRFFSQKIKEMIDVSRTTDSQFGVCFLDLDDFKVVNDTLGHDAGDQLLIEVSERIKSCIFRDCFLSRFGGDEFALLIPENDGDRRISAVGERVVRALNEPFDIGEHRVYIGVSIGKTMYPGDATDVTQLLRHADMAMYQAKDEGKNTIRGFSPELAAEIEARQNLVNELRMAIAKKEVTIVYQPKRCLKTNRVTGCEALVRWTKDGKAVCPGEFIDVAEKSGLIFPLGDQIIEMAMRQAKQWRDENSFDGRIAINLSPRQLNDPEFIDRFEELLKCTDTCPEWFELEITENAMMENIECSLKLMEALNELGVKIAIDDFGTGYSSLNYLKTFPVSTLKIDLSFVRDLPNDLKAVAVAKTVLSLGHGLGIEVVAEGVETEAQRRFLEQAGCDVIQGYLVNRPLAPSEFIGWLQKEQTQE